jgi:hypothetical protein
LNAVDVVARSFLIRWPFFSLCETFIRPSALYLQEGSMSYSPTLIVHILGGVVGLMSGTAAMTFRKGSPRHVLAGRIFVASMVTMGAFAAYLAIVRNQPNNIGGGILTVYLVGTAWLTARRRDGETSRSDWVWLLIPLANGILLWMTGVRVLRSGHSSLGGASGCLLQQDLFS